MLVRSNCIDASGAAMLSRITSIRIESDSAVDSDRSPIPSAVCASTSSSIPSVPSPSCSALRASRLFLRISNALKTCFTPGIESTIPRKKPFTSPTKTSDKIPRKVSASFFSSPASGEAVVPLPFCCICFGPT